MNDANSPPDDSISALADGALAGSARAQAAQCVLTSVQGLQTWHTYHVIGDVLRSAELAPRGDEQAFWGRLSQKVAMEPAHPLQEPASDVPDRVYPQGTNSAIPILSANDAVWRWAVCSGWGCGGREPTLRRWRTRGALVLQRRSCRLCKVVMDRCCGIRNWIA